MLVPKARLDAILPLQALRRWTSPRKAHLGWLALLLVIVTPAMAEADPSLAADFGALRQTRDDLAGQLAARRAEADRAGPGGQLTLTLSDVADDRDARVVLRRAGGAWRTAFTEVDAWQQGTMQEWRGYHHRNRAGTNWRPTLRFETDPAELRFDDEALRGPIDVDFKLDRTLDERMPPGSAPSFWERFVPVGNSVPRPQRIELDAAVMRDALRFDLVLEGGVHWPAKGEADGADANPTRRPILVQGSVPATRFTPYTVRTPTWSGGHHEADGRDLRYDPETGRLRGTLRVIIHSDSYVPVRGRDEPMTVTFEIDARVRHHELTGTFAAAGAMGEYSGKVRGEAGPLVRGRFTADGAFGPRVGTVVGMWRDNPAPVAEQLTDVPALPENAEAARRLVAAHVDGVLDDIRALSLAMRHFPLPLRDALRQTDTVRAVGVATHPDGGLAEYVHRARRLVESRRAPEAPLPPSTPETIGAGPSTHLAAAEASDAINQLPDDLGDRWLTLPAWSIIGPFTQRIGLEANDAAVSEIVPHPEVVYHQPIDRLGAERDAPEPRRWQSAAVEGMRIAPPWDEPTFYNRFKGEMWYARAVLHSPRARRVTLSVEASDFAKLWVNGELVWIAQEKPWTARPRGRMFVTVDLREGENTLLFRAHRQRRPSWVRLAVGGVMRDQPEPREVARSSEPDAPADPDRFPIAWDIDEGINVAWRNEAVGDGPAPVATDDLLLAGVHPDRIVALDPATGEPRWADAFNALQSVDQEAYGRWVDQRDPAKRWAILQQADDALGLRSRDYGDLRVDRPVTDGKHVWAHNRTGVAAGWSLTGESKWTRRTNLGRAKLHHHGDLLLIEGDAGRNWPLPEELAADADAKTRFVGVLALDASTGEVKARFTFPGDFDPEASRLLTASTGDRRAAALLTATGHLIDLPRLTERGAMDVDVPVQAGGNPQAISAIGSYRFTQNDRALFLTLQDQSVAIRTWATPDGRLAYANQWEHNYEHTGFGSITAPAAANERLLFQWQPVLERGPHNPDPRLTLLAIDARSGRRVARLKPALDNAVQHYTAPALAGGYVYALDSGGGSHGGHPTHGRIAVATADDRLQILARNRIDKGTDTPPIFAGNRMILRSPKGLTCIAVATEAGRAYQRRTIAETLLDDLGSPPHPGEPVTIAPSEELADVSPTLWHDRAPLGELTDGRATEYWLGVGPIAEADRADRATRTALAATDPLTIGHDLAPNESHAEHRFQPLDRDCATQGPTGFRAVYNLQGTGERVPVFNPYVDARCISDPDGGSGLLYTVLDNRRDRIVLPRVPGHGADRPGYELWLNDKPFDLDQPLHLAPGLYPLLIRIDPAFYDRPETEHIQPINVVKALKDEAIQGIDWPTTWHVVGLPPEAPALDVGAVDQIPETIQAGGRQLTLHEAPVKDHTVNLLPLVDLPAGQAPDFADAPLTQDIGLPTIGYAFAEIEAPADGYLYLTASADWFMRWYLDGEPIYSTLDTGNGAAPRQLDAHPFAVPVTKGKHLLAVEVRPGSKGWSFTSQAGFARRGPDTLADYHTPSKREPAEPDPRFAPAFDAIPHPPTRLRHWRDRARAAQPWLQWIADTAPEPDLAERAAAYLQRADSD